MNMKSLYKFANLVRRFYWFIFRPHTKGVKCLIKSNGLYLLIQTTYSGKYWTLPGGGIKQKETPEEAAIREVKEEVGILIDNAKLLGSYESTAEYKKDTVFLTYAETSVQQVITHTGEIAIAKWFSTNTLPREQSRALREAISLIK
jgi:8-oxo-dGTP pyrophosphatase MutT (NUDIX family)